MAKPKKVALNFLRAWKNDNCEAMYKNVQLTWRAVHSIDDLCSTMKVFQLIAWRNLKLVKVGKWAYDVLAEVRFDKWYSIEFRMIKEIAPLKPSKHGDWGVNPFSLFTRMTDGC